jgi:hypothetical protein
VPVVCQWSFSAQVINDVRLKQDWTNSVARFCRTPLASTDRLSSRANSSILFAFLPFCRLLESMMPPASRSRARWRWKTKAWEGTAGSDPDPPGSLPSFRRGFRLMEIVVPKREWREGAVNAKFRRRVSSLARRRWRLSVACWSKLSSGSNGHATRRTLACSSERVDGFTPRKRR